MKSTYFFLRNKLVLFFIVIGAIFFTVCADGASFPAARGYVNDFANVISDGTERQITALAAEVEQKTSAQIAVVTVSDLGEESLEYYANELFTAWGIGQKGKDNGVLILLAFKEKKVWIETGYGLEAILPDGKCGQISREIMIPFFRNGDYSNGLLAGTEAVAQVIARDAGISLSGKMQSVPVNRRRSGRRKPTVVSRIFSVIIFLFLGALFIRHPFLFLLLLSGSRSGGGFGGGGFSGGSGGFGGFGGGMSGGGGGGGGW